jgi:hypothetical protein
MCSNVGQGHTRVVRLLRRLPPFPRWWKGWRRCSKQVRQWPRRCSKQVRRCSRRWSDKLLARRHLGHGFNTGAVQRVLAHGPAKDLELVVVLGVVLGDLGRSHGVFGIGENGHARQEVGDEATSVPSRAILASLFLATRTDPPASRMRARRSCISATVRPRSGQPRRRQSFRRSGRVPRPLSLSGLYPQFHSSLGGFPSRLDGTGSLRRFWSADGASQTTEPSHR